MIIFPTDVQTKSRKLVLKLVRKLWHVTENMFIMYGSSYRNLYNSFAYTVNLLINCLVYNSYKSKKDFFICLKGAIYIIFTNNCLLYILLILFL